ncbi:MAG TPA: hypothetical protein VLK84_25085 [Longimicrobium sp.]|nr:hypothetical protein [Longimicrobium sp.]
MSKRIRKRPWGTEGLRRSALLLGLALLCACGRGAERTPLAQPDTARWSLGAQPLARIGAGGGAGQDLHRVYGGLVNRDGRIVVGNSGTGEIRFYDRTGIYLFASGREGSGPGEFRAINWLSAGRGDSILVYDLRMRRFSVLNAGGNFARAFESRAPRGSTRPVGVLPDGSVLVAAEQQFDPRTVTAGLVRDSMDLIRISPTGQAMGTVGRFPGAEWLVYDHSASYRSTQLPFGRAGHAVVSGENIVYASSDRGELLVHDLTGRRVGSILVPGEPRRLTDAEVEGFVEEAVEDAPERSALLRQLQRQRAGRWAPRIADLRVDRSGNLWVQRFPEPDGQHAKWTVFTRSGELVGSMWMPAGSMPLDLRPDALLVREHGEDGTEQVSLRELVR